MKNLNKAGNKGKSKVKTNQNNGYYETIMDGFYKSTLLDLLLDHGAGIKDKDELKPGKKKNKNNINNKPKN